ncbi:MULTISPECIES: twin-arginine translocase TatA/TatE family subunit [Alistipes]|uniref:Sec-independent protein translocase protein TatA n=1 Tax=Alistipes hominis TaxID=2763015 RepID=A0ABR7CNB8_9BACT|nr:MULTISPECIES: twin-arginine translocase TatA/TatE family subunit [Alistipes]MBS5867247.1 twin-arginine translocase TatA/TatE family subunit [Alistipes indistinctus]MBC5617168.1 twin-arginine translocase TatA/TatE family subunit [Alistipes hominis]MBS1415165.1 twin-arginine translocase TatA/TatE family subunit [Alistipes sp.]RHO72727.1 twin-arginine translocase TatA/TatE family subunit [Alistipes sp. AF48-12]RHR62533.1 twin-arginine translocase TatA/TatE family subunit [Alistipes sp. AF17-16
MLNLPLLIMGVIGPWQLLVIVALVVIFFGGKKIPELMRGMGRGIKEFKDAINKDYTAETPKNETTAPSAPAAKPTDETTKN